MVHPNLTQDPVSMQGNMGRISHVDFESETIYVNFRKPAVGAYDPNALLMLIPGEILADKLRTDHQENALNGKELVELLDIYLLNASMEPKDKYDALDRAMGNENIMKAVVFTVQDYVDFQIDRLHLNREPGRSR